MRGSLHISSALVCVAASGKSCAKRPSISASRSAAAMILKRGLNAILGIMATAAPPSPMMPMPSTVEFSVVMRPPPTRLRMRGA